MAYDLIYRVTLKYLDAVNLINSNEKIVILLCLAIVLVIGLFSAKKVGNNYPAFFYTDKKGSWISVGLSLFAVNSFSEYFLIAVSLSVLAWWAIIPIEIVSGIFLFIFGYYLLPIFLKEKTSSVSKIFEKLYNKNAGLVISALSVFIYIPFRLSLVLLSAGILFSDVLGWNYNAFILLALLISGIFTVAGGLTSIIKVQYLQSAILVISTILLVVFGFGKSGNHSEIFDGVSGGAYNLSVFNYFANIGWIEIIIFTPIAGFWYWCTDQHISRRILSGSDLGAIKKGIKFGVILKIIPVIFLASLGLISNTLTSDTGWDKIFSSFISSENLSAILRLSILVSLLLVLVQSFSSILISVSTLITVDFFESRYGITNGNKLVLIGRFTIFIIVIGVIFLVPFLDLKNPQAYINILRYQIYASMPLAAVFLFVFFYKKTTYAAMLAGLVVGETAAIFRIILEFFTKSVSPIEKIFFPFFNINALHVSIIICLLASCMLLLVSNLNYSFKTQLINYFRKA